MKESLSVWCARSPIAPQYYGVTGKQKLDRIIEELFNTPQKQETKDYLQGAYA